MSVSAHVSDVVDFEISYDVVTVTARSNGEQLVWTLPFPIFERCAEKALRFCREHRRKGEVVQMGKRG